MMNEKMVVITSEMIEEFMLNQLTQLRNWTVEEAKPILENVKFKQPEVYDNLYRQASDILFDSAVYNATRILTKVES